MKTFHWSVRTRLLSLSMLSVALILLVGATGWFAVRATEHDTQVLAETAQALQAHLSAAEAHEALHAGMQRALVATRAEDHRRAQADVARDTERLLRSLAGQRQLALAAGLRAPLETLAPALERDAHDCGVVADAAASGDLAAAHIAAAELDRDSAALDARIAALTRTLQDNGASAQAHIHGVARWNHLLTVAIPLLAMLLVLVAAQRVRVAITQPLGEAVEVLDAIAAGDLRPRLSVRTDDELGRMARAVNRALESLTATLSGITRNATTVGNASEELASVSQQLFGNTHETSAQSSVVSSAAEQVNANVRHVAASAQQVGASIRDVARNAQEVAAVARQAVQAAHSANDTVRKLGDSSEQIESVVKLITAIAEQTNILALNAEIEAARAGDAGKGFAVVANEVKELARETARATGDIGARIDTIQLDSRAAMAAIAEIVTIIHRISETQAAIATAVEEQSAATAEITRNMGEAARGTAEIATTIGSVARATESTSSGAHETQKAANELAMMATELQRLVNQFRWTTPSGRERAAVSPLVAHAPDGAPALRQAA